MKLAKYITGFLIMALCWTIGLNTLLAHNRPSAAQIELGKESYECAVRDVESNLDLPAKEAEIIGIDLFLFEPLPEPAKKSFKKTKNKR